MQVPQGRRGNLAARGTPGRLPQETHRARQENRQETGTDPETSRH